MNNTKIKLTKENEKHAFWLVTFKFVEELSMNQYIPY